MSKIIRDRKGWMTALNDSSLLLTFCKFKHGLRAHMRLAILYEYVIGCCKGERCHEKHQG